ncbi:protein of unknown function [Latilactobacillus sakei]|nr:hypothetical protein LSAJ112_220023 [Latilactobacillus sakei]SON65404.1 protein of unknown function [Latilactobacillus sakei]SON68054.1 protein of unknown function [Latilactobacillus sakei]SON69496.1 protein of unknown function [Latilactobacillus sakei]SON73479.1 protein of unknown function [Latilactobacillus sakei]
MSDTFFERIDKVDNYLFLIGLVQRLHWRITRYSKNYDLRATIF